MADAFAAPWDRAKVSARPRQPGAAPSGGGRRLTDGARLGSQIFVDTLSGAAAGPRAAGAPAAGWDEGLRGIEVKEAEAGRCVCHMEVTADKSNRYGTLHGGCIATLVDVVTTAAQLTATDIGGVSLGMTIEYLKPAPVGETVAVEAKVVRIGNRIAVINAELRLVGGLGDGQLVAQGTHTKFQDPSTDLKRRLGPRAKL